MSGSAGPGTCSATPASGRTATSSRSAIRSSRGTRPEAVADGKHIREYLTETARKYGIDEHIRFNTHVRSADWDSATDTWTVRTGQDGESKTYRGRFLFFGTGYYNYDAPYTPEFPGIEDFAGEVVHPQHWPESLDYTGKRVVVIGSGATAISLIPIAGGEGHARHHAAALAQLHILHTEGQSGRQHDSKSIAAQDCQSDRQVALCTVLCAHVGDRPQGTNFFEVAAPARRYTQPARGLSRRHAFQAAVQPVGPAVVRDPGWRLVQRSSARAASMW